MLAQSKKGLVQSVTVALLAGIALALSSCATKVGPSEAYKGETPSEIFENAEADMDKGDFTEAIKRFEALQVQYPLNLEARLAELQLVYAYYRKEEYGMAQAGAARFIRQHPMSENTDYAYFMQALSYLYENQGNIDRIFGIDLAKRDLVGAKKAFSEFATLVDRFPNSRYAPAAYQYMIYIRNMLARHQLQLAKFYYDRAAYVACVNRANQVIRYYQGAPVVPDALVIMAKAYRAMHLTQQEKDIIKVIQYNYPNSSYVREAQG